MDAYDKSELKNQILAIIDDFTTEKKFEGKAAVTATLRLQFLLDVEAEVDGPAVALKDVSGEKVRLVIEESGQEIDEYAVHTALEAHAESRLNSLDEEDLLELANDTGYAEIIDLEIDEIDEVEEV